MNTKFDMVKIVTIGSVALSVAGSIAATWANTQRMNDAIAKEVEKAVENLK